MAHESSEIGEIARELRRHVALMRSTGIHGLSSDGTPMPEPVPAPQPRAVAKESIVALNHALAEQPQEQTPEPSPAQAIPAPPIAQKPIQVVTEPSPPTPTPSPVPAQAPQAATPAVPVHTLEGSFDTLEALRAHIGDCTRCTLHAQGRQHVVFGVGNPNAEIMFIGEAPGAHEDREGIPFVGKAGELLTKIIEGGMKRSRDDVYIANVIKCRPPQNRDPSPEEVATCRPFILKQIDLVKPRVIITLGRVAAQALLQTKRSITHMRGEWQELEGTPVMPTFHPAYLLRNPAGKRQVWSDIQAVIQYMDSNPQ